MRLDAKRLWRGELDRRDLLRMVIRRHRALEMAAALVGGALVLVYLEGDHRSRDL